jgi:hypothetical protein
MRSRSDDSGQLVGEQEVIQMGIKPISTDKSASHQEIKHGRDARFSVLIGRKSG